MAVTLTSLKEGWTGVESSGSGSGKDLRRSATRVFTATTTSTADSPVWTYPLTCDGLTIPKPNTAHPDDATLRSGQPRVVVRAPGYFEITVPYETRNEEAYDDPLEAPAEYSWDDSEYTQEVETDLNGAPYLNSLREPLNGGTVQRTFKDSVLTITRNQAAFVHADKLAYQDTVCSEAFWGAEVGRCRMDKIRAQSVYDPQTETRYWRVTYQIVFRMRTPPVLPAANAWWRLMANKATHYRLTAGGPLYPTPDGKPRIIVYATGVLATPSDTDIWIMWKEYESASWAALAIGDPDE